MPREQQPKCKCFLADSPQGVIILHCGIDDIIHVWFQITQQLWMPQQEHHFALDSPQAVTFLLNYQLEWS